MLILMAVLIDHFADKGFLAGLWLRGLANFAARPIGRAYCHDLLPGLITIRNVLNLNFGC